MFKIVYYFIEFEKNLIETIKTRDVEEITDRLNPRALTKCKTNTLYMAMKVDILSLLRRLPCEKFRDAVRENLN